MATLRCLVSLFLRNEKTRESVTVLAEKGDPIYANLLKS